MVRTITEKNITSDKIPISKPDHPGCHRAVGNTYKPLPSQKNNKTIKNQSWIEDKAALSRRSHGWMILSSYTSLAAQKYLALGFDKSIKIQFLKYRLGLLPGIKHHPHWLKNQSDFICRLCGAAHEDMRHLLCTCKELAQERKQLLKPLFNQRGIRTRRQAVLACFAPEDTQLNCHLVKYLRQVEKRMPRNQDADPRPLTVDRTTL